MRCRLPGPQLPAQDRELPCQVRLGTGRESRDLLVPHMHPFDLALATDRIGQPVRLSPTMPYIRFTPAAARVSANWSATVLAMTISAFSYDKPLVAAGGTMF